MALRDITKWLSVVLDLKNYVSSNTVYHGSIRQTAE